MQGQEGIVALVVSAQVISDQIMEIKGYVNGLGLYRNVGPEILFGFLRSIEASEIETWWLVASDSMGSGIREVYGRKDDDLGKDDCVKEMVSRGKLFVLLVEDAVSEELEKICKSMEVPIQTIILS